MKIAIAASPGNLVSAKHLIHALSTSGLDAYGLKFNANWQTLRCSRIDSLLKFGTHIVCLFDAAASGSSWFAFLVGYARGQGRPVALYRVDPDALLPAWLADLHVLDSEDEAVNYYMAERVDWLVKEGRRQARASLLELGISWHSESMVQCVRDGDIRAVELFIKSGFPVDLRDKHGVPIICLAARTKHKAVAALLLDYGVDVDSRSDDRGYSALMDAVQQGDEAMLRLLLEHGADVNIQSKDGQTALILAIGRNDLELTSLLLENGANPQLTDKLGLSALKYARLFNKPEILALLDSLA